MAVKLLQINRRAIVAVGLGLTLTGRHASAQSTRESEFKMHIDHFDHLVLTVSDVDKTCDFYAGALGVEIITFGKGRKALKFGNQKINLHQAGNEIDPKAFRPTPGSGDFCVITTVPVEDVKK